MTPVPSEVWFLTGSQGMYGPDTLAQVAAQSTRIADVVDGAGLPVRVVWKPVLTDAIHPLSIGGREDPVRLIFDAAAGPALVAGLADLGERLRLTANLIDVVAPPHPLPKLPVARAVWRPRPNWRTSTESWLTAGAPHHTVLTAQLGTDTLIDLCEMLGIELALIDGETTTARFAQQLRWNQAYFRLARGF
jgi:L-arabinose isomerase